ncbi:MAG TPA: hypothetical protein VFJ90_04075, partial [Candidatus Didemnitutus sp.]|nr:hypothetical protein [Candidatus Didemnitutus sp.]
MGKRVQRPRSTFHPARVNAPESVIYYMTLSGGLIPEECHLLYDASRGSVISKILQPALTGAATRFDPREHFAEQVNRS